MPDRFITDMGAPLVATASDGDQGNIGRYGVWETKGRRKPKVIACGDDLPALQADYGPGLEVSYLCGQPLKGSTQ